MGIVRLEKPNDFTTFTFEWIFESHNMTVTRRIDQGPPTVWDYTKPTARKFWNELTEVGYRPCQ